jgi:hypothetical protein
MTDDAGNMSIDFLTGFTIFIIAFIWVATLIPGILVGLQSNTIDYDAIAYRTGVILVENPGYPVAPGWESFSDLQKSNVTRFGLAVSQDTPNILSQEKVNRFFCTTAFSYPEEYQQRAIFGDRPYHFNISLMDIEKQKTLSIGEVLPDGYGYMRRLVKIKEPSNATIDAAYILAHDYTNTAQVARHEFSIMVDNKKLLGGEVKDPVYQINPSREQILINITDLPSTVFPAQPVAVNLTRIMVYKEASGSFATVRTYDNPYIDGNSTPTTPPVGVQKSVTLKFDPQFFAIMRAEYAQIYINLTFDLDKQSSFLNNSLSAPFDYSYNPADVTQPRLRDAVLEVAVW